MRSWSLARRVLVVQWIALAALTIAAGVSTYLQTRSVIFERTTAATTQLARLGADDPRVAAAYASADPTAGLQPLTDRIIADSGMDFATFISREGLRLSYHRPGYVGTPYSGTLAPVWNGETVTEVSTTATAGESTRSVVPIYATGPDGERTIVGALTVGKQVKALEVMAASDLPNVLITSLAFAVVLGLGSWWGSRYLQRATAGLGPEALSRHFAVADAALLSVDEGILLADSSGRIVFHNRAADALLGLRGGSAAPGGPVEAETLGLPPSINELVASGRRVEDEPHRVGTRMVIVSQRPLQRRGAGRGGERGPVASPVAGMAAGTVLTIHDHSAVQALAGELASTRSFSDALRAQNHDHANRLHTLLGLLEVDRPDEARALLIESLASSRGRGGVEGADGDAVLAALTQGKIAQAAERGVELSVAVDLSRRTGLPAPDLVGIFGNLLDNAIDAAAEAEPDGRWVSLQAALEDPEGHAPWLVASVANGGAAPSREARQHMFEAGFSTKPTRALGRGQGLAIVAAAVARLGGRVEVVTDSGTVFTVELPLPADEAFEPVGRATTPHTADLRDDAVTARSEEPVAKEARP
ncbi:sensor histidine kinase [Galactobacter valiniphilus]|uniref:sensor histidine kinase n=1 Tax=Galactobacter valiniphilus TaxID=2676122 RepID=UPI0037354BE6